MAAEGNDFNINLGDTIYSDSEVGAESEGGVYRGFAPALAVKQKWAKYRQNLALANLQKLRDGAALYSHPDDHEWLNDFAPGETLTYTNADGTPGTILGSDVYNAGVKAFRNYAPVGFSRANGFYRTVRWGKNLELFFLDERSFRSNSAKAPNTWNTSLPPLELVSIFSCTLIRPMPISSSFLPSRIRSCNDRPSRSSRQTVSTSPARATSSARARPGRAAFAPLIRSS